MAGDFTAWAPVVIGGEPAGSFAITLRPPPDRSWRHRFLVDSDQWMNDPGAGDYVRCADGGAVSVLHT